MATSYDTIDNMFLGKITDGYFTNLSPEDLQDIIDGYRAIANSRFKKCLKLKDRDDTSRQYNEDLTDDEVDIQSNFMVLEWIRPQLYNAELIKQSMSTKDYQIYSEANHLEKIMKLKQDIEAENNRLLVSYTYSINSLDSLKKKVYSYD